MDADPARLSFSLHFFFFFQRVACFVLLLFLLFSFSIFERGGGRPSSLHSIVILRPCDSGLVLRQDLKEENNLLFFFLEEICSEDSIPSKSNF